MAKVVICVHSGSAKRLVQELLPTGPGNPPDAILGADKDKALVCVLTCSISQKGYNIHYTTKTMMDELDAKLAQNKVMWTGCLMRFPSICLLSCFLCRCVLCLPLSFVCLSLAFPSLPARSLVTNIQKLNIGTG